MKGGAGCLTMDYSYNSELDTALDRALPLPPTSSVSSGSNAKVSCNGLDDVQRFCPLQVSLAGTGALLKPLALETASGLNEDPRLVLQVRHYL